MLRVPDRRTDHEVELAFVIGRTASRVPRTEALRYVAGYAIGLDISIRGTEDKSCRKSADTYSVLGPWLVTADEIAEPGALDLELRVNGERRQYSNTRHMTLGVAELVEMASSFYTLHPGDVVFTGTPEGVSPDRARRRDRGHHPGHRHHARGGAGRRGGGGGRRGAGIATRRRVIVAAGGGRQAASGGSHEAARAFVSGGVVPGPAWTGGGQGAGQSPDPQAYHEQQRAFSARIEATGLAQPFKGITTNGTVAPGLFAIRSTGVSTAPVRQAAEGVPEIAVGPAAHQDGLSRRSRGVAQMGQPASLLS